MLMLDFQAVLMIALSGLNLEFLMHWKEFIDKILPILFCYWGFRLPHKAPIPNPETEQEERFNETFCSIRCGIERCIGVLKNRFRCLLKHRVLHHSPRVAATIVNACVVLHNMCIIVTISDTQEEDEEGDIDFGIYAQRLASEDQRHNLRVNMDLLGARQLRQNIINNHFF
nr:unnamed protein product [Callosobruchus analis]